MLKRTADSIPVRSLPIAKLNNKDLKKVIDNMSFMRLTERTVTSKEELLEQLRKIKKQGYSIGYGERAQGAMSISMPVTTYYPLR
ncbi:MAG: IclR family transcriptional regulator domain-containing protein [Dehalococcoidales bacterium]